jgi:hypothetical protein
MAAPVMILLLVVLLVVFIVFGAIFNARLQIPLPPPWRTIAYAILILLLLSFVVL